MFSSQLGRAVRASTTLSHTPATHHRTATACLATSATSLQPKQRRLSSSKASSSPDGNNSNSGSSSSRNNSGGAKPLANAAEPEGAATATATSTATTTTTTTSTPLGRRASGRRTRDATYKPKKTNGAAAVAAAAPRADGVFERLPKVAETGHLHPQDVSLSSFFSLHRPLSLSNPIPHLTTQESFASLFEPRSKRPTQHHDVIHTLSNTITSLDATNSHVEHSLQQQQQQQQEPQQDREEADQEWPIFQTADMGADIKHLDTLPRPAKTLEEMLSQMRPFLTPPPPSPAAASLSAAQQVQKTATPDVQTEGAAKKSFRSTITVTENTSAEGVKYYTASTTPMVRIPPSSTPTAAIEDKTTTASKQPFLERMQQRQMEYNDYREDREEQRSMMLISVKRQRKLKMKKHKYKKLMKRTRNLRRRLDRN